MKYRLSLLLCAVALSTVAHAESFSSRSLPYGSDAAQVTRQADSFEQLSKERHRVDEWSRGGWDDVGKHGGFQAHPDAVVSAVPEPSTYALMGVGLLAIAFIRRRVKK